MANRSSIPDKWLRLFDDHLPGYDPIATSHDYVFNAKLADKRCAFFPAVCTHVEGEMGGKPFHLEDWQKALVGAAFGWVDPRTNLRRYRKIFQYVGRKNGKTTLIGGLIIMMAILDNEAGAQLYSLAANKEQATLVFRQSRYMIEKDARLKDIARVYVGYKSIEFPQATTYKVLASTDGANHGLNVHFGVVDELHACKNVEAVNTLLTGTATRAQPLIWIITTADYDRQSLCNDELLYAERVRDGHIDDPSTLPAIYNATLEDDWTDPEVWKKANPNYGVSVKKEYLEREAKRAQDMPSYENTFKRLHLNIKTQTAYKWIDLPKWDCAGDPLDDDVERLRKVKSYGGLDLASTRDLTSLAIVWQFELHYEVRWWFWCPAETAHKRVVRDRVPYDQWQRQGYLEYTGGDETDFAYVRGAVSRLLERYKTRKIGVDRLFQGAQLSQDLQKEGFDVTSFSTKFGSICAPSAEFERLVHRGEMHHGGNPMARWMAGNVVVDKQDEMPRPNKEKSTERIDGIVAAIMALGLAMTSKKKPSVYRQPGRMRK